MPLLEFMVLLHTNSIQTTKLPIASFPSGFSGHGISHAPATGMLIAEELLDGRAHTLDIDPLRITRFADGGSDETHIV